MCLVSGVECGSLGCVSYAQERASWTRPLWVPPRGRRDATIPMRPVARTRRDAGSETDSELLENPRLPKSPRPVPKSPPSVQSFEMVFVSIVTAALSAMARPHRIFAPVFRVML